MLKNIKLITEIWHIAKNTVILQNNLYGNAIFVIIGNIVIVNYG